MRKKKRKLNKTKMQDTHQFVIVASTSPQSKIPKLIEKIKRDFINYNPNIDRLEYCPTDEAMDNILLSEGLLSCKAMKLMIRGTDEENNSLRQLIHSERKFDGQTITKDPMLLNSDDPRFFSLVCVVLSSLEITGMKLICLQTDYHTLDSITYYMFTRIDVKYDSSLYHKYVSEGPYPCLFPLFFIPLKSKPNVKILSSEEDDRRFSMCKCNRRERQKYLEKKIPTTLCGKVSMKKMHDLSFDSVSWIPITSWKRTGMVTHAITVSWRDSSSSSSSSSSFWSFVTETAQKVVQQQQQQRQRRDNYHITIAVVYIPEDVERRVISEQKQLVSDIKDRLHQHHYFYKSKSKNQLLNFGPVLVLGLDYVTESNCCRDSVRDIVLDVFHNRFNATLADKRNNPHITVFQSTVDNDKYCQLWSKYVNDNTNTYPLIEFNTLNFIRIADQRVLFSTWLNRN